MNSRKLMAISLLSLLCLFFVNKWFIENVSTSNSMRIMDNKIKMVPNDFHTIQSAIDSAVEGDIVLVEPGIYYENLIINKSIVLIGSGYSKTIIDGNKSSHVVTISSSNVVVSGFTFQNGGYLIPSYYGIKIINAKNVTISDNYIVGNFVGIKLGEKQCVSIQNVICYNVVTQNRYGIFADHASENLFFGNIITKNYWNGIELAWGEKNIIQANDVSFNGAYGLEIVSSTPSLQNKIFNNNFVNNSFNISVSNIENLWDNGYPMGGNYWGKHNFSDKFSGEFQNKPSSDGIADQPLTIDSKNCDQYPLLNPFEIPKSPVAEFVFSPNFPKIGEEIHFNASASFSYNGPIVEYFWLFGDGYVSTGVFTSHTYIRNGSFPVLLKIKDSENFLKFKAKFVFVENSTGNFSMNIHCLIFLITIAFFVILIAIKLMSTYLRRFFAGDVNGHTFIFPNKIPYLNYA